LSIDETVAGRWGRPAAAVANQLELPVIDGLLAAAALHHDLMLVTRNTRDIEPTGVSILNPWI
jgi:predicted nucleic acid-binding protein